MYVHNYMIVCLSESHQCLLEDVSRYDLCDIIHEFTAVGLKLLEFVTSIKPLIRDAFVSKTVLSN